MLFNSSTFIIFFAVVLILHYLPLPWTVKKVNLLIASYIFYAAWNPPFVLLLMGSTVIDWFVAIWIYRTKDRRMKLLVLMISLAFNFGVLGFFKYGRFLLDNFGYLAGLVGVEYAPPGWQIVLPVGISFYTFLTMSYTLDVYWGRMKPWNSFLDYTLFVTFFPHLVAGPIVRADQLLPQFTTPKQATGKEFYWGLVLLVLGLFEKVIIADRLMAPISESVFNNIHGSNLVDAWCGTFAFAGQIFCDFAGYSTCAIGVAMCLGFWLPQNFRHPYGAVGFSDFWRRWHVSLSTWLRDYLYIPLGGNRKGRVRTYFNLLATMLLGGLWHGASWTFVIWGGLHGMFLVLERFARRLWEARHGLFWSRPAQQWLLGLVTFLCICLAWVFFRANTFAGAFDMLGSMVGLHSFRRGVLKSDQIATALVVIGLMLAAHGWMRHRTLDQVAARVPWPARAVILAGLLCTIVTYPGESRAFIYFQF
jgi:D-alanyl-lipoteichoic acid acyltransferase DltB (MBOAT superfamily)